MDIFDISPHQCKFHHHLSRFEGEKLLIRTPITEMSFLPLQIPPTIYKTPSEIEKHLSVTEKKTRKLSFN